MKAGLMLGVNHNSKREENDFYATNPKALKLFLNKFEELNNLVWECACGEGHLSKELINQGYEVYSSDLINRGYGKIKDFLQSTENWKGDILTNPPFKLAEEFVKKGIELIEVGNHLILFLKIQFLEGQKRNELFKKFPIKYVFVHSSRQQCALNGEFEKYFNGKSGGTQQYAWYIWEKGFSGNTIIKWLDSDGGSNK